MRFDNWLNTFVEEKGFWDASFTIEHNGTTHFIDMPFVTEFLERLPKEQQQQIKATFVKIDFYNGDCLDFFEHLARGYVEMFYATI